MKEMYKGLSLKEAQELPDEELLNMKNFGRRSLQEIRAL